MTSTPLVGGTFFGLDISQLPQRVFNLRRRFSKRVLLLEFGSDALRYAEAKVSVDGIQLNHLSTFKLPADALDRGVPSEPVAMAELLKEICLEKKIPAHRVAVCLSPEVAFQRVIQLPADLTDEQARLYVLDPANGIQIPFPLIQTDFDLCSFSFGSELSEGQGMKDYLLSAIPQVLVDQVIAMLELANQELQLLELGCFSHLRLIRDDLLAITQDQVHLVLELLPDCSYFMVVGNSGPMAVERLAAIRTFPEPEFDEDQTLSVLQNHVNAESLIVQEESYLPISELDLRALVLDLKFSLKNFNERFPNRVISCLHLMGSNTSHPNLAELLTFELGLNSVVCKPLLAPGLLAAQADDPLLQGSINRLVGLALGLLPKKMLLATSQHSSKESLDAKLNSISTLSVADVIAGKLAQSSSSTTNQFEISDGLVLSTQQPAEQQELEPQPDSENNLRALPLGERELAEVNELTSVLQEDSSVVAGTLNLIEDEQQDEVDDLTDIQSPRSSVDDKTASFDAQLVDEKNEPDQISLMPEDPSQWPSIQKAELDDDHDADRDPGDAKADDSDQDVVIALDDGLQWPSIQKDRDDAQPEKSIDRNPMSRDQLVTSESSVESSSAWPSIPKAELDDDQDVDRNPVESKADDSVQDILIASDEELRWPSIQIDGIDNLSGGSTDLGLIVNNQDALVAPSLEDQESWPSIQKVNREDDSKAIGTDRPSMLENLDVEPKSSLDEDLRGSVIQNIGDDAMHKLENNPDAVVVSEDTDNDLLLILNDVVQEEIGAVAASQNSSLSTAETSLDLNLAAQLRDDVRADEFNQSSDGLVSESKAEHLEESSDSIPGLPKVNASDTLTPKRGQSSVETDDKTTEDYSFGELRLRDD